MLPPLFTFRNPTILVFVLPSTVGQAHRVRSLQQPLWSPSKWSMEIPRRLARPSRPRTKLSFRHLAAAVLDPKRRSPRLLLRLGRFLLPQDVLLVSLTHLTNRPFVPKSPWPAVLLPPLLQSFVLQPSCVSVSSLLDWKKEELLNG
jgi:hypothetical protein